MRYLCRVINHLTMQQVRLVTSLCREENNGQNSKKTQLFYLIKQDDHPLNKALTLVSVSGTRDAAAEKTGERLQDTVYEAMLISAEDRKCSGYLPGELKCNKLILIAEMLIREGLYAEAGLELNRAMKMAKAGELYKEQIKIIQTFKKDALFFGELYPGMQIDRVLVEKLNQATGHCEALIGEIKHAWCSGKDPGNKKITQWKSRLSIHGTANLNAHSERLTYLACWIEIFISVYTGNERENLSCTLKLINSLSGSCNFGTVQLLIAVRANLSLVYLRSGKLSQSATIISKIPAGEIKSLGSDPHSLENIFIVSFETNCFDKAEISLETAFSSQLIAVHPYLRFKWTLYRTLLFFHQEEFRKAFAGLENIQFCNRQKTPLEIYCSVLAIMCGQDKNVREELLANSETRVRSLSRYAKAWAKKEPRLSAILKVTKTLLVSEFDFEKTAGKEIINLEKLASGSGKFGFQLGGYEVARFDAWFEEKKKRE
jgi:hypothetical protein